MRSAGPGRRRRLTVLTMLSVALLVALVAVANPQELLEELYQVDLGLLALVVGLYLGGMLMRALRWHVLMVAAGNGVRLRSSLVNFAIGQAIGDLTPVKVAGDVARVWGINQEEGVPIGSGLASVVSERLMDLGLVSAVMLLSLGMLYPTMPMSSWQVLAVAVGAVVAINLTIIVLMRRPQLLRWLEAQASRHLGRKGGAWRVRAERWVVDTLSSFTAAMVNTQDTNRRMTLSAAVLTVPVWGFEFARLFVIMAALGAFVSLPAVVVASTLALTVQVFLPAGSGNVAVISDVFTSTGIGLATATAGGLLSVATSIWISVPLSLLALLLTGIGIGGGGRPKQPTRLDAPAGWPERIGPCGPAAPPSPPRP